MKKVDYRCDRCLIVESKWLLNGSRSVEYTTCTKCGGESKRISTESVFQPNSVDSQNIKRKIERF